MVMIGVVLLGRLFNIHSLPLSLVIMPNSNICGKLRPVKKGFGLKAKETGLLSWPRSPGPDRPVRATDGPAETAGSSPTSSAAGRWSGHTGGYSTMQNLYPC